MENDFFDLLFNYVSTTTTFYLKHSSKKILFKKILENGCALWIHFPHKHNFGIMDIF